MKRLFVLLVSVMLTVPFFAQPKYIFYFIGDGMGINEVVLTEMYLAELDGRIGADHLCMTKFPVASFATSYSASNSITDSSAAGTVLASGSKTVNGRLGLDDRGKHHITIAEYLRDMGYSVGIMTSVSIDHATPGAFYAAVKSRNEYYTIGQQLAASKFDFFAGASFLKPNGKDKNDQNLYDLCSAAGYTFVHGQEEYLAHGKELDRVILIQKHEGVDKNAGSEGRIPYAIDNVDGALTLPQITSDAIDFLSSKGKPFFMMVEGGQIDWACHGNDAATVIGEVLEFDKSIALAYEFYQKHPDETLIVVTADHETGGLALGNSDYTLHLKELKNQTHSSTIISEELKALRAQYGKKLTFEQVKDFLSKNLGLYSEVKVTAEENAMLQDLYKKMMKNKASDDKNMYASLDAISSAALKLLNKKAHLGWTTNSHSASPVPVFAIGAGAERFNGHFDNSEFMSRILGPKAEKQEGVVRFK